MTIFNDKSLKSDSAKVYHCGTLTYTKIGLFALFAWIVWGDFCLTLMEAVVPSIMPLKLKALGAPNWLLGAMMTTIPGILNIGITPYLSLRSDRYRSRWGRRLPFIIWTLPFLCASLCLLAFSESIAGGLHKHFEFLKQIPALTFTIGIVCVFIILFQFFNMFVMTVFWYLFNDVVPLELLARFIGVIRIAGALASAFYNYFVFQHAETHMREILLGAAIVYFIGFTLLCLRVKEGNYPAVENKPVQGEGVLRGFKKYFKESFSSKIYWLFYLMGGVQALNAGIAVFAVFNGREMGLTLKHMGYLGAIGAIVGLTTIYLTSIFVDRWQPIRVNAYMAVFSVISASMGWVWPFVHISGDCFYWLCLSNLIITAFQGGLLAGCGFPLVARLFPKTKFGQFCGANALVAALGRIVAGVAGGIFIDLLAYYFGGGGYVYRFLFLWSFPISVVAAGIAIYHYSYWQSLGGDANYQAPTPWSTDPVETMPIASTTATQSYWLDIALRIFNALFVTSIAIIPLMMGWMFYKNAMNAFSWHLYLILPASVFAWFLWNWLERKIRIDMKRNRENLTPLHGIPHHGVLIVVGITYFSELIIWLIQIIMPINEHEEKSAIVFGIAHVLVVLMLTGAVFILSRAERNYPVSMDTIIKGNI